jgi:putative RNA 2'-phosphotransferase
MKNASKRLSYILRHNPGDLTMDGAGWVKVKHLLVVLEITLEELQKIVDDNDKQRFEFQDDGWYSDMIRATQGHNKALGITITHNIVLDPTTYYHGTQFENVKSIEEDGLISKDRISVHLSKDLQTAIDVGGRRGQTVVVFEIDGKQMQEDGYQLFESNNGVILADFVPRQYIKTYEQ